MKSVRYDIFRCVNCNCYVVDILKSRACDRVSETTLYIYYYTTNVNQ